MFTKKLIDEEAGRMKINVSPEFVIWRAFVKENLLPIGFSCDLRQSEILPSFCSLSREISFKSCCVARCPTTPALVSEWRYRKNLFAKGKQWKSFWCAFTIHFRNHHATWHFVVAFWPEKNLCCIARSVYFNKLPSSIARNSKNNN